MEQFWRKVYCLQFWRKCSIKFAMRRSYLPAHMSVWRRSWAEVELMSPSSKTIINLLSFLTSYNSPVVVETRSFKSWQCDLHGLYILTYGGAVCEINGGPVDNVYRKSHRSITIEMLIDRLSIGNLRMSVLTLNGFCSPLLLKWNVLNATSQMQNHLNRIIPFLVKGV
jgi:hypothetical protein